MASSFLEAPQTANHFHGHAFKLAPSPTADDSQINYFGDQWEQDFNLPEFNMLPLALSSVLMRVTIPPVPEDYLHPGDGPSGSSLEDIPRKDWLPEETHSKPIESNQEVDRVAMKCLPRFGFDGAEFQRSGTSTKPSGIKFLKRLLKSLPPKKGPCVGCLESIDDKSLVNLPCSHKYCGQCLSQMTLTAMADEQLFPPKCCYQEIPSKEIASALTPKEKVLYRSKKREYATPVADRWYCPAITCGKWIPQKNLKSHSPTQVCPHCSTSICSGCRSISHSSRDCPDDPGLEVLFKVARLERWQRCYNCGAVVERMSGCDNIKCRCQAQFCYKCGNPWPHCVCFTPGNRQEGFLHSRAGGDIPNRDEDAEIDAAIAAMIYVETNQQ